jgi:hypothetical protein
MRNAHKILAGKPQGKRTLARPKRREEYDIRIDLIETDREGMDWIHLCQNRELQRDFINRVMHLQIP